MAVVAQNSSIQYFRPNNKEGLHVFEPGKADTVPYTGFKVRIGGNFTQGFQNFRHTNTADAVIVNGVNANQLIAIKQGFNRAMANLNIDAQLDDGIRMNLTLYLSARHHEETWVKGGFVQFDKLPFIKNQKIQELMEHFTIKIGDYGLDYGDHQYRRSDGGNAIHNPFVENYIVDAFATEIGGEIYYHSNKGLFAMAGMTNGELNPSISEPTTIDSATGKVNSYTPAFHGKIGYDKQVNNDLRVRVTGSLYTVKSAANNTLFFGDRTGSHYYLVMENSKATATANAWSGRYNPQFSEQVTTVVINPFIKYKGLELFGAYELAKGRRVNEAEMRNMTQYAADIIYRFPAKSENGWIGARYNRVKAEMPFNPNEITIQRFVAAAGWFLTKNIMLKAEYAKQDYDDFPSNDIRSNGSFKGWIMEAVIGF
ncbi:MAG: hypothetical protein H7Y42_03275 [Chitinophagaceae bacterium]|nr:hypothetical protein [Chitinophagaceae bacterium]